VHLSHGPEHPFNGSDIDARCRTQELAVSASYGVDVKIGLGHRRSAPKSRCSNAIEKSLLILAD
jgi:hypothetical protein